MASQRCQYAAAACLAGLTFSAGALAQNSIARCRVTSISRTARVMQDAYTEAWLDIGNFVCGSMAEETTIVNIDQQVMDVAFAIAEAFAEVSVNCQASGNADVRATAYALAEQRATALGSAVAEIFASAEVCDQCTASITALTSTTMELVSVAVAEAWTELYLFSDGGFDEEIDTVTSNVIVETIANVLSSITGVIRAGAEDGCSIEVIQSAEVGDFVAMCEVAVSGDPDIEENNAIAMAGAEAAAFACDGDIAEAAVTVSARAAAMALARAVAQADVFCESTGGADSMACALAETDVRAVAMAQAEAFASAFARAETCGCNVSVFVEASTFDEIWAEAAVNAVAEACLEGPGLAYDTDFDFAVEEAVLTATAVAIASAVAQADEVDGNECRVSSDVCAATSRFCVANFRLCGGTASGFDDVRPCCDPANRCFVQDDRRFVCRRSAPSFFDGRIAECTLDIGLLE